ncbi:MAG: CDP-glycerol glycerophosphotransferase [Solirubrobacteraceae bacterium]|nr:CDP-glycerol glycerophosphotransferase [Solirubrobacteraceae bacterium]
MPSISVVVPIFDVEPYLAECLQSIARQSAGDLEVIMVDDGSTDGSAAIASRFAAADERFTLIRQANHGLGHARNVGARRAQGEYLAFVDADDVLPDDAYEHLRGALERSGSDFASGNVRRIADGEVVQAAFLSKTFARTRLRTHVTRFRPLLGDRTAWNKLFRRAFWEAHDLRFPEGVVHEDIPVILPAHFLARSVDVVAAPVYHWRRRSEGAQSITQRRLERSVMRDRLTATEAVLAHIDAHGPRRARRWYQQRLVADDLRLHLNLLDEADAEYRQEFMARANALLADAPDRVFARLPAIDRLKWHLLRRGLAPELVEVVAFHKAHPGTRPPLRRRGRFYGDYPYRDDARLAIPASVYRLGRADEDLAVTVRLEDLRAVDGRLTIRGHAYVGGLGAPAPDSQSVRLSAVRRGRLRAVRMRLVPVRLPTRPGHRPELGGALAWAGFEASLDAGRLARAGRRRDGTWELCARLRTHGLSRYRTRFAVADAGLVGTIALDGSGATHVQAACSADGAVTVEVRSAWLRVRAARRLDGDVLELTGDARGAAQARLAVRRRSDGRTVPCELEVAGDAFTARIPLSPLRVAPAPLSPEAGGDDVWDLRAIAGGQRLPVALALDGPDRAWSGPDERLALVAGAGGGAAIAGRAHGVALT